LNYLFASPNAGNVTGQVRAALVFSLFYHVLNIARKFSVKLTKREPMVNLCGGYSAARAEFSMNEARRSRRLTAGQSSELQRAASLILHVAQHCKDERFANILKKIHIHLHKLKGSTWARLMIAGRSLDHQKRNGGNAGQLFGSEVVKLNEADAAAVRPHDHIKAGVIK
jgi:hypothetical protein